MTKLYKKITLLTAAFLSIGVTLTNTGCASGGYHLSRTLAGWMNKQDLLIRVLLYIFLGGAFFFTILADMIYFNTVDFWTGKVTAGIYEYKDSDKAYVVNHSFENDLKRTEIQISDLKGKKLQNILLKETATHEIELYVDGTLKAKVNDLESLPKISYMDSKGNVLKQEIVPQSTYAKAAAH